MAYKDYQLSNSIKAWDKSLEEKSEKFSFNLNEKCIEELSIDDRNYLLTVNKYFDQLKDDISLINKVVSSHVKYNVSSNATGAVFST